MRLHRLPLPLTLAGTYLAWAMACSTKAEIARSPSSSGGSGALGGSVSVADTLWDPACAVITTSPPTEPLAVNFPS